MNPFATPPFDALLSAALVGTARPAAPLGAAVAGAEGKDDSPAALVAELLRGDDELALLRAAGVAAVCAQAGVRPQPLDEAPPAPAAPESRPEAEGAALHALLQRVLQDGPLRLQIEAGVQLRAAGLRLPTALLPAALDAGRQAVALRAALEPVLGERGRWLATLNPQWRYASGAQSEAPPETLWQEGSLEQRRAVLIEQRAHDPAAARARLTQELPQLAARERAELLPTLLPGLGPDDEPLLAALLKDRSREVRQAASQLLLRLPGSDRAQRVAARLAPLLTRESGLLRRRWQIDAPAAADADWKELGLEAERPKQDSLGERAWWLFQLVRHTPPGWWSEHTGMTPAELLTWAAKSDWREALLRGWRDAVFASGDLDWCEAVLAAGPKPAWGGDSASVLALLPLSRRAQHWTRQLAAGAPTAARMRELAQHLLAACPEGELLPAELSQALASALRQLLEGGELAQDWLLRQRLPELCCLLHPQALAGLAPEALRPRRDDPAPLHAELLAAIESIVAARRSLHALSSTVTPS